MSEAPYIVLFKKEATAEAIQNLYASHPIVSKLVFKHKYDMGDFRGFAANLSPEAKNVISNLPEVREIEADGVMTTC
ncbi:hypothetical protein H696_01242 [Fonticula alba]|uniref:Inhibitor I9 domain-containing protein n=1 Tax=Fonticula alba TaxID=691883 RepID=A0A058ZBQ1_FONAL|nr:hypothetical protein H696_01242 [Fonticula alba]KCV71824.1 hypothetical protein H696_01242 [Fonticula alba]|eukprot:XP_009493402.1 hypothetical protein H696_01242 [Fonticula alba]